MRVKEKLFKLLKNFTYSYEEVTGKKLEYIFIQAGHKKTWGCL